MKEIHPVYRIAETSPRQIEAVRRLEQELAAERGRGIALVAFESAGDPPEGPAIG